MGQGVEWALHVCATLAGLPAGGCASGAVLAELFGLPAAYLSKHLHALSRAGLLAAVPGRQGGYQLARSAAEISVLEVVEAVDGSAPPFRCTEIRQRGPTALPADQYRGRCSIAVVMAEADRAWRGYLASVSIADVAERAHRDAGPAVCAAQTWLTAATTGPPAPLQASKPPRRRERRRADQD